MFWWPSTLIHLLDQKLHVNLGICDTDQAAGSEPGFVLVLHLANMNAFTGCSAFKEVVWTFQSVLLTFASFKPENLY